MSRKFFVVSLAFLLTLVVFHVTGNSEAGAGAGEPVENAKIFEFAERLFEEEDYFRAITEYKRFIFLTPESELTETCYFRICESYFGAGRWQDAIDSLDKFLALYPKSRLSHDALLLKGRAEKYLKRYHEALSSFERVISLNSGPLRDKAYFESALVYVELENWVMARESFSHIPEGSVLYPKAWIFSSGLEDVDGIPHKSPAVAGTLAAILPGSGHLYTERPRDALVAFLLNAAFIWAAVELFQDDNYVAGGVVTFFELGWYTGNIYSAVGSAHKYNRRAKNEFIHTLKERSNVSYYFDDTTSNHYLMLCFKF
jgi:tetratricopeptide (TPR) repeat protein